MRTVIDLFMLAGAKLTSSAVLGIAASSQANSDRPTSRESEPATFADVGERIGEDNEVLRNLLIDTGHQLGAIDDLKESFSKLVEPLSKVLTALEHEKADKARAQGALAAIRSSHEVLRGEHQGLEKQSAELKSDNERLAHELDLLLQKSREAEAERVKLAAELSDVRVAMSVIVKQLAAETGNARSAGEQKVLLSERAHNSDKRAMTLEAEVAHARERLSLLENDKESLQAALDKTLADSSRMSRHLAESENALNDLRNKHQQLESALAAAESERNRAQAETSQVSRDLSESEMALSDARGKLQQIEGNLAVAEAERNRLAAACDEANERRQSEVYALGLKLDALRSHSDAAEKLLADVRQSLVSRTEELRVAEAKLTEAVAARSEAEKKAEHLVVLNQERDQQVAKLEQSVESLSDRCRVLSETLTSGQSALIHAREKIKSLGAEVEQLQQEAATTRAKTEEDFVQLNATIEHERCERALAEGALETTRNDYARLHRQMAQERSVRRADHQRRVIRTPT